MTQEQQKPETRETPYDGKRAKVIDKEHPWFDTICTCLRAEMTGIGWGMVFEDIETGHTFFIFKGKQIKWID